MDVESIHYESVAHRTRSKTQKPLSSIRCKKSRTIKNNKRVGSSSSDVKQSIADVSTGNCNTNHPSITMATSTTITTTPMNTTEAISTLADKSFSQQHDITKNTTTTLLDNESLHATVTRLDTDDSSNTAFSSFNIGRTHETSVLQPSTVAPFKSHGSNVIVSQWYQEMQDKMKRLKEEKEQYTQLCTQREQVYNQCKERFLQVQQECAAQVAACDKELEKKRVQIVQLETEYYKLQEHIQSLLFLVK